MSILRALSDAESLEDLANILGFKAKSISFLLYVKPRELTYREFEIAKASGGKRQIAAPNRELKLLQQRLAAVLLDCREELEPAILRGRSRNQVSHAFLHNRSIFSNARSHRRRRYVFNLDLSDFFGSINFGRVRGFFIKDRRFKLQPRVATLIAQIACYRNGLPQGSPCSPIISELIGRILDQRLIALAKSLDCTYSRYADDLTFSSNRLIFPREIAVGEEHQWTVGMELQNIIRRSGFSINVAKTRMQYRDSRQVVTGLVVNRFINVRNEYRRLVRAMVHRLQRTGGFEHVSISRRPDGDVRESRSGKVDELHGMLGFINQAKISEATRRGERAVASKNHFPLFRRFLLFKEFYATARPVVVCEGKTDNVYLTHALRALAKSYPDLASVAPDGKIELLIRRFRYTERSTGKLLGIHGGGGDLKNLLISYVTESRKFSAPCIQAPVIVLVDNDSGADPVFAAAKEILGKRIERSAPFTRICANMFLMPTPLLGDQRESKIEDFFDEVTLKTRLDGKSFDPSGKYDERLYFGKADFAYRVVQKHAASINFDGFKPLLDAIVSLIQAFRKTLA